MIKGNLPQPKVKHLLCRAAFGTSIDPGPADITQLYKDYNAFNPLTVVKRPSLDREERSNLMDTVTRRQAVREMLSASRQELIRLNQSWVTRMTEQPTLRERMTFFWHGHFACRTLIPFLAQQQNNTLREFALGTFPDLLMAVSKDPAMLQFLNNQQNRKDHPNENFAREVMELFTIGRGNYTEEDVREAARAFTGWGFNLQSASYQFRPRQHDYGSKTFRGATGNFSGEDVLKAILEDRQTARFLTTKVYRNFVSDTNVNESTVNSWSDSFFRSGYDIEKLLKQVFESREFGDPANMGSRVKSPIDLLVGFMLHTGGHFEDPQNMLFIQRALGQVLFYPPNVSGWHSGTSWIDSSSLTFRTALPSILLADAETDFEPNDDGDDNGIGVMAKGRKKLRLTVDWDKLAERFADASAIKTIEGIEAFLLARPTTVENRVLITRLASGAAGEKEFIRKSFIGFMSVPEYQLC